MWPMRHHCADLKRKDAALLHMKASVPESYCRIIVRESHRRQCAGSSGFLVQERLLRPAHVRNFIPQ